MKISFCVVLFTLTVSLAHAEVSYLECANSKKDQTDIGFYNHYGDVVYQMSVPYKGDFLYLLGHCNSQHQSGVGIPYTCEVDSKIFELNLVHAENNLPAAEVITHSEDGSSSREQIPCTIGN